MAKQLQLTIPTPCHEDWDAMTPADKGRFCGSCQKQVVDFSTMSDRQVAEFFKKPRSGSVCGRFMSDQLEREIEIPKKRIPWLKYFFQFALPAFLLSIKSSSAKAQGEVRIKKTETPIKNNLERPKLIGDTILMDEVVITSLGKRVLGKLAPFHPLSLKDRVAVPTIIVANKTEAICDVKDLAQPSVELAKQLQGKVGGVQIIVGGVSPKRSKRFFSKKATEKTVPLLLVNDTNVASLFKIYPNPVAAGSAITIKLNEKAVGNYILELLNQSGQSIHQQHLSIDRAESILNINLPSVLAGSYFIFISNKKTGKKSTEKIIIQ